MDALEARRQHGADAEQPLPLGGPVARRAGAVAIARHQHDRLARLAVAPRHFPDSPHFAAGRMRRVGDRHAGLQQVDERFAVERGPQHHFPVAAP